MPPSLWLRRFKDQELNEQPGSGVGVGGGGGTGVGVGGADVGAVVGCTTGAEVAVGAWVEIGPAGAPEVVGVVCGPVPVGAVEPGTGVFPFVGGEDWPVA